MAAEDELQSQENINRVLSERQGISANLLEDIQDYTNILQDQLKLLRFQATERKQLNSITRTVNKIAQEGYSVASKELGTRQLTKRLQQDLVKLAKQQQQLERLKLVDIGTENGTQNEIRQSIIDNIAQTKKLTEELKLQKDLSDQISKSFSVKLFGGISDIVSSIPGLRTFATPFAKAEEAVRNQLILNKKLGDADLKTGKNLNKQVIERLGLTEQLTTKSGRLLTGKRAAAKLEKLGLSEGLESINAFQAGATSLGKTLLKSLGPLVILGKVVQSFFELNKASVEFQRLTGQNESIQAGLNLRFATSVDYLQTATELTQKLGVNANNVFRSDTIAAAAEFKNLLGLSGDEAGNLAIIAEATGTSLDKNTEQLVDQVSAFNKSNKSAVSQGKVLKDVANTSEAITVSLGANPAKLAAAASQAARLGMQLKDVDAIANSLLDFESSIEAELEAQLLTGKEINLAKAREYALTNQLDKLGQEIFENTADIAEFGQMNRIAQEAYAKSLGMTRDQLARTAYLRALEAGMTEDQAKAAANVSLEDMKRVEAQESLNKSIEKMAQALAGPADLLASMVGHTTVMYGVMAGIAALITTQIVGGLISMGRSLITMIPKLATILGLESGIAAAKISGAMAATVGLGALALAAGIAYGISALKSSISEAKTTTINDGIISPEGGLVVSGPEGSIKLNPNDSIVAGTDLFTNSSRATLPAPTSLPSIDLSPLLAEFQAMKQILTSIRDKEGNVYLDTDLVGKALVIGSTSI